MNEIMGKNHIKTTFAKNSGNRLIIVITAGRDVENIPDGNERPAGFFGTDGQHIIGLACPESIVQPLILGDKAFFGSVDHLIIDKMDSIFLQRHMRYLPIL